MPSGSISEAIRWSIDEAKVKNVLLVGHSEAEVIKEAATRMGDHGRVDEWREASTRCDRLLAGARRAQDQIQQAKRHFARQIGHLWSDTDLVQAFRAGNVQFHTLFYIAESGTFSIYNIGEGKFVPIV